MDSQDEGQVVKLQNGLIIWDFPKIRVPYFCYLVYFLGSPIFGNPHINVVQQSQHECCVLLSIDFLRSSSSGGSCVAEGLGF